MHAGVHEQQRKGCAAIGFKGMLGCMQMHPGGFPPHQNTLPRMVNPHGASKNQTLFGRSHSAVIRHANAWPTNDEQVTGQSA